MPTPENYGSEFLTCHLGYTPLALIDDYVNHFNEPVGGIMDAIEDFFVAILAEQGLDIDSDGRFQNEVRAGIHRLQTLLEHLIDKNVDKLEIYLLRNILTIPRELECVPTAFLPHYRDLEVDEEVDEAASMEELEQKAKELAQLEKINRRLRSIQRSKQRTLDKTRREAAQRSELLSRLAAVADKHVTLTANMRSLHNNHLLLKDAEPFGMTLGVGEGGDDDGEKHKDRATWQIGRIGYLNWQTGRLVTDESVGLVTKELDQVASLDDLRKLLG